MGNPLRFATNSVEQAAEMLDKQSDSGVGNEIALAQAASILALAQEVSNLKTTFDLHASAGQLGSWPAQERTPGSA